MWSYHPLLISMANTGESLFIVNRIVNRPSHHDGVPEALDLSLHCAAARASPKFRLPGSVDGLISR